MSRHILINIKKMEAVIAVDGDDALKRCEYWADILIPETEFYICGTTKQDLKSFPDEEIRTLINSLSDVNHRIANFSEAVTVLRDLLNSLPLDDKTVKQLKRKLGHKLKEQTFSPVGVRKIAPAIPKRPSSGTDEIKPWEAADYFFKRTNVEKDLWAKVVAVCQKEGLSNKMISEQFVYWKNNKAGKAV